MKLRTKLFFLSAQMLGLSMCFSNAAFAAPSCLNANIAVMEAKTSAELVLTDPVELHIGESYMVPESVIPDGADRSKIRYATDNWDIARVNTRTGRVTAKSAGTATITVTSSGEEVAAFKVVAMDKVPVTGVVFRTGEISLVKGERSSVSASVLPEDATDKKIKYSSSDTSVVTVSQGTGLIKAVGGGTCTITATSVGNPEVKSDCVVTVVDIPLTDILLDRSEIEVPIGAKACLSAKAVPSDASDIKIKYVSSNTDIATINSQGSISGRSAGECEISVSGGGIVKTCKVTVVPDVKVESVVMANTDLSMSVGEMKIVSARVLPENATNNKIRYTSSDSEVATIGGKNGVLKAKKLGTCTITAISDDGNKTAECKVTVQAKVESLKIVNAELFKNLEQYITGPLEVKIYPASCASEELTFSSSNPEIAEVNEKTGFVTAKQIGECVITVKAANGVKTSMKMNVVLSPFISFQLQNKISCFMGRFYDLYDCIVINNSSSTLVTRTDECFKYYAKDIEFRLVDEGNNNNVCTLNDGHFIFGCNAGTAKVNVYYKGTLYMSLTLEVCP